MMSANENLHNTKHTKHTSHKSQWPTLELDTRKVAGSGLFSSTDMSPKYCTHTHTHTHKHRHKHRHKHT